MPIRVAATAILREVARTLEREGVDAAIVRGTRATAGIGTERDLVLALASGAHVDAVLVVQGMHGPLVSIGYDETVLDADGAIATHHVRRLVLTLLDLRAAADSEYEADVSAATVLLVLNRYLRTVTYRDGGPLPPGFRSTALDGDVLEYIGRRRAELVESGDVEGVKALDRWCGGHASELHHLRQGPRT
jgi:CBS domain-containing protein